MVYQRAIPEQTSGGAEVSLLPGRGRPFLEPCFLFWPQPSLSLSSHLLSMTRKATTPRHMMFLPPTSLGLTPGSLSQGWPLCLALCHTPAISPALPLPVCLVPGHSVSELEPGPLTQGSFSERSSGRGSTIPGLRLQGSCLLPASVASVGRQTQVNSFLHLSPLPRSSVFHYNLLLQDCYTSGPVSLTLPNPLAGPLLTDQAEAKPI